MRYAIPMRAICTANLVLLHSGILIVCPQEYKSLRSSVYIFLHFPATSSRFFFFVKYVSKVSYLFLGAYAKLRKATISFVMSVRSSISPREITWLPLDGFLLNFVFEYFSKISQQNSSLIKF